MVLTTYETLSDALKDVENRAYLFVDQRNRALWDRPEVQEGLKGLLTKDGIEIKVITCGEVKELLPKEFFKKDTVKTMYSPPREHNRYGVPCILDKNFMRIQCNDESACPPYVFTEDAGFIILNRTCEVYFDF